MMTRPTVWRRTEARLRRQEHLTYAQARRLFNALYQEACALRVLPSRDPLKGLEADLRLAAALHGLTRR